MEVSTSKNFSCKFSLTRLIVDQSLSIFQPAHMIWKAKVPTKIQLFAWSLALAKLNTGHVSQTHNPNVPPSPFRSVMCKRNGEISDHLFQHL